MELHQKDLGTLFEQLGLASDAESIDAFFCQSFTGARYPLG